MKRILLIVALVGLTSLSLAQDKEKAIEKYKDYKPCIECFDDWKNSNTNSSQSNILMQNKLAQQSTSYGKRQLNGFGRIVIGIVVGAITLAIVSKTTNLTTTLTNAVK